MEVASEVQDSAVRVREASEVGAARRSTVGFAERLGFPETQLGKIALAATELATNLVRHGGGGELILTGSRAGSHGMEILALDRGRGIMNVPEALRDGYSTGGSQGAGLGAVARQADACEVYSVPGAGTVVLARFLRQPTDPSAITVGGFSLPHPAETVSGDAWAAAAGPSRLRALVADGLGHGPSAAEAAREAARVFRHSSGSPSDVMADAHRALRHTRGAALGIAELDLNRGALTFVGVGNISGSIVRAGESRSLVSHAGIVGHKCHKIQEFTYPWSQGAVLVLYSDGLQSHWHLEGYPGLLARDPAVVAATLYRDHVRGRDDVTVVVMREAPPA